jgi:hypothetical protein
MVFAPSLLVWACVMVVPVLLVLQAHEAVVIDVARTAKIPMPLAGVFGYVAKDEGGGNAFGASAVLSGVPILF